MSLAARDERHTDLAREPPPGVRHVHAGGLLADVHDLDARREQGIEERHDVVARQREDAGRAEALKRPGHDVGPAMHRHVRRSRRELNAWAAQIP